MTRNPGYGELSLVPVRDVYRAVQMLQSRIRASHVQEVTALQDKFADLSGGGGHLVAVLDPKFVVMTRLGLIAKQHCRPGKILVQRGTHGREAEDPVGDRLLGNPLLPAPLVLRGIVLFRFQEQGVRSGDCPVFLLDLGERAQAATNKAVPADP